MKGKVCMVFFFFFLCRFLRLKLVFTVRGNRTQDDFFCLSSIVCLPRFCRSRPFWCTYSTGLSFFFGLSRPSPPAFDWGGFLEGGHLSGPLPKWKIMRRNYGGLSLGMLQFCFEFVSTTTCAFTVLVLAVINVA